MEHRASAFCIKLADTVLKLEPIYPYLQMYCKDYWTTEEPEVILRLEKKDIEWERQSVAKEAAQENLYSDGYLELLAAYRKIAEYLLSKGVLLFHGSVVAVDGEGFLFTAKSGTGKSTHTALWRQLFGERAIMINDDKPLLKLTENKVIVYGTPWAGKHGLHTNQSVLLKGFCVLERATENTIVRVTPQEIYGMLLQQVYRPFNQEAMQQTLGLVEQFMESEVGFYRLGCNQNIEAAKVAYAGMKGAKQ